MNYIELVEPAQLGIHEVGPEWLDSPFLNLKVMPPKQKGKRFEEISIDLLKKLGYTTKRRTNSNHDVILESKKVEIKGSTLRRGCENEFTFLQIRPYQDYEQMLFTCFYPQKLEMWLLDKQAINDNIVEGMSVKGQADKYIKAQHGGSKAQGNDTFCFMGHPSTLGAVPVLQKQI
jgi:hypothetical protein